jgi:hypothetical protein
MNTTDGIGDYDAWAARATAVEVSEGLVVLVGKPSDLLISKEAADRPKDRDVLPLVRAELLAAGTLDPADVRGAVAKLAHEPPPDPATESFLGARPAERRTRALWDRGANLLTEHRRRWGLAEDDSLDDMPQAKDRQALQRQLDRLQLLILRVG